MPSIDFVLDVMSTSVNFNVLATIDDPIDGVLDVSATAIFYISFEC